MLSHRTSILRISRVPWANARKVFEPSSNLGHKTSFYCFVRSPQHSVLRTQYRTSIHPRKNVEGEGLSLSQTAPVAKESAITVTRVAYAVKLVRLPFLILAISTIGYQRGVADAIRNPLKLQQGAFETLLSKYAVQSEDEVEIITERGVRSRFDTPIGSLTRGGIATKDPRAENIARVGREILKSSQTYVRENLEEAVKNAKNEMMKNDTINIKERELAKLLNEDPNVKFWVNALEHIEGASLDGIENWSYVLISSPIPNAFVSEMLPQKVFVTTGLFEKFVRNDHELAIILGHEVSHLIKGDVSKRNYIESIIRGAEILVLMLDPTEGLLSLGIAGFLLRSREALVAKFSRTQESEADELGCKLAAMSCYDTRRGVQVLRKMQESADENGTASNHSVLSSHPPSQTRYDQLLKLVETQNFSEFSYCNTLTKRIARAFRRKED